MTIDEVITMLNSEDCNLTTNICLMRYKARDCWKCILKEYTKTVYNNAIDDFVKAIVDRGLSANGDKYCITHYDNYLKVIKEIAEQLKAGGENDSI